MKKVPTFQDGLYTNAIKKFGNKIAWIAITQGGTIKKKYQLALKLSKLMILLGCLAILWDIPGEKIC